MMTETEDFQEEIQETATSVTESHSQHITTTIEPQIIPINNFKSTLAQVLLALAKFLIFLLVGLSISFVGVSLPLLHNGSAGFVVSRNYTSYLVSTIYLFMPVGTLLNIPLSKWGRKPLLFCSLISLEINWIITYFAENVWTLILARVFAGIGTGLALCLFSLVAETCEPRLRGMLDTISSSILSSAYNFASLMSLINNFKTFVLLNSFFPLVAIVYVYFIPESPLWLCTQGRYNEALKSLVWLRGWQYNQSVQVELNKLKEYCSKMYTNCDNDQLTSGRIPSEKTKNVDRVNSVGIDNPIFEFDNQSSTTKLDNGENPKIPSTEISIPSSVLDSAGQIRRFSEKQLTKDGDIFDKVQNSYSVKPSKNTDGYGSNNGSGSTKNYTDEQFLEEIHFLGKIKYIFSKDMLRPTMILSLMAIFVGFSPNLIFPNYLPLIMHNFNRDTNHYQSVEIIYGSSLVIGHIICSCLIMYTGKKRLLLFSMSQNVINLLCFTMYDIFKQNVDQKWFLDVLLIWNGVASTIGPTSLIFPIMGELFPVRGRILGVGLIFNSMALTGFFSTLIFPWIFAHMPFYVITIFFALMYLLGYVIFSKFLIETEGKTLQEINEEMDAVTI